MIESEHIIERIIESILCSVIASFVFWILTFRISRTKLQFSECIEKSPDVLNREKDQYRYRVKLINVKNTNLIDVSFIVRLTVHRKKINNNTFLQLGYPTSLPVLYGKKWQMKNPDSSASWIVQLKMTDSAYEEFSKSFYPCAIRKKADERTLSLTDIFEELGNTVGITIYAFGYDAVTGARRQFQSKEYRNSNIVKGRFRSSHRFKRYKDYISYILEIEEKTFRKRKKKRATAPRDNCLQQEMSCSTNDLITPTVS